MKSFAAENIKLFETSGLPPTKGTDELVKRAYEMSKRFLQEIKQIETDKGYVAPSGAMSRRGAFTEADLDGKTAFDGGRKRRRTSKRSHRKSKTAKRRRRR